MAIRVIRGLDELKALVGEKIGTSDWVEVTQEQIQAFADVTGDHQWVHVDVERAERESPYGTTIAHGFFTISLCPALTQQIFTIEGVRVGINYGLNRVRFPTAVKVGARVRMSAMLLDLKELSAGVQVTYKQTFEVEGEDKPACVAETVARLFF